MQQIAAIALAVLVGTVSGQSAEPVDARILQHKLDRVYFDAGTESRIFPGSCFEIICGQDTTGHGTIEASLPGLSLARVNDQNQLAGLIDSCCALIQPFTPDPDQPISLGLPSGNWQRLLERGPDVSPSGSWAAASTASISTYPWTQDLRWTMVQHLQSGIVHGFISTHPLEQTIQGIAVDSLGTPFVATLLPNPVMPINADGFLTTALYYLYNQAKLPQIYDGSTIECHSFVASESEAVRPLPHDPQRGLHLLRRIKQLPLELRFAYTDPSLERAAQYFGDLLAQSGLRVLLTRDANSAHCRLSLLPYDELDEIVVLESVMTELESVNAASQRIDETLSIARNLLAAAQGRPGDDIQREQLRRVERVLRDDLGVFPLFRPRAYFVRSQLLIHEESGEMSGWVLLAPPTLPGNSAVESEDIPE